MKRALLLINPKSRKGAEAGVSAKAQLESHGFRVDWPEVGPSEFSNVIKNKKSEIDLVIVGGGDGSVRCALSGVLATDLPLGILPLGTANNLARNVGLPVELDVVCRVLWEGWTREIDIAEVNGIPFLNVVGMGLSTEVNEKVEPGLKKRLGVVAYMMTALKHYRTLRSFKARVVCDDKEFVTRAHQITVCNGRHFGSGLTIRPDATIDDGYLDVAIMEAKSLWSGVKVIHELVRGHGRKREGLRRIRAKHVTIETNKPLQIDVDGDLMTKAPADFRVKRNAVRVIAPKPDALREAPLPQAEL